MKFTFPDRQKKYFGLYVIFILLIVYLIVQILNGRFSMPDFEVYYRAAVRMLQSENLFRPVEDGHFHFKYSPVSAIYFIPLTIFRLKIAKIIYWFISSVSIAYFIYLFFRLAPGNLNSISQRKLTLLYLVIFLALGVAIEFEIHLGQVNIIILCLLLLSIFFYTENRPLYSGLFLAVSLYLKPFGLILIPYYLVKSRWKECLYAMLFVFLLFFLPWIFYGSWDLTLNQYREWYNELLIELGNKQDLLAQGNHSIFSVIARYTPLRWIHWTDTSVLVYQVILLIVIGASLLYLIRKGRSTENMEAYTFGLLLCLVPMLAYTNINLFMFNGMVSTILLLRYKHLRLQGKILFIGGLILSGFNIRDLWGYDLADTFEALSLVTIGTLILWLVLYFYSLRTVKSEQ